MNGSEDETFRILRKWPTSAMFKVMNELLFSGVAIWEVNGLQLSEIAILTLDKCGWTEEEFLIELEQI